MFVDGLEYYYRVRFDEAGPDGFCGVGFSAFRRKTWHGSIRSTAGFGRTWYRERACSGSSARRACPCSRNVDTAQRSAVSTEVIGFRRVIARGAAIPSADQRAPGRRGDDGLGPHRATPSRPVRPPAGSSRRSAAARPTTLHARAPARAGGRRTRPARASGLACVGARPTPMAHVNNAVYVDYIDEQYLTVFEAAAPRPACPCRAATGPSSSAPQTPGSRLTAQLAGRLGMVLPVGRRGGSARCAGRARGRPGYLDRAAEDPVVVGDEPVAEAPRRRRAAPPASARSPRPTRLVAPAGAPGGERYGESVSTRQPVGGLVAPTVGDGLLPFPEHEARELIANPSSTARSP